MGYVIADCGYGWVEKLLLVVVAKVHETLGLSEMTERGACLDKAWVAERS